MLTRIDFHNFRAIADASLELGPFTLIIGPNGSGKSTVVQAIMELRRRQLQYAQVMTLGRSGNSSLDFHFESEGRKFATKRSWERGRGSDDSHRMLDEGPVDSALYQHLNDFGNGARQFAFEGALMRAAAQIKQSHELNENGADLAAFLDYLKDNGSDRFQALVADLHRCLPEFDDVGFDRPNDGQKAFKLRRTGSRDYVAANDLSEGTVLTLAILAVAHQPDTPSIVCLEEPDRGIHPRLLEEVRNALYRLSFPESFREKRRPIQVVATTHSPYFLDLFKDNPEQVVVADKSKEKGVTFRNLGRDPEARQILEDTLLGQAWTAGAIGGVPTRG